MSYRDLDFTQQLSEALGAAAVSVDLIHYSINHSYKVSLAGQSYFCRVYRLNKETREAISAEHAYLDHLKKSGVAVASAVPFQDKSTLKTFSMGNEDFYFALFEYAQGQPVGPDRWDRTYVRSWGRLLGQVHRVSKQLPHQLSRPQWNELSWAQAFPFEMIDASENRSLLEREWNDCHRFLDALEATRESYGIVHFDFHPGNLIETEQGLVAVDFDDCCRHFYGWDFALPFHRIGRGHMSGAGEDLKRDFVAAYKEVTSLPHEIEKNLRNFERLRHVFMLAWLHSKRDEQNWREIFPRYLGAHLRFLKDAPRLSI